MNSNLNQRVDYEYPLSERVRSLLRLELLLQQFTEAAQEPSPWAARFALQTLFQIQELCNRKEFKTELTKELERHAAALGRHRQSRGVDPQALAATLNEVELAVSRLREPDAGNSVSYHGNNHEFLLAVRQRIVIPGGTCSFDLPMLHHWLQQPPPLLQQQLEVWLQPQRTVQQAVELILQLLRASAVPRPEIAPHGFFQQTMGGNADSAAQPQLLRVILTTDSSVFPEFSGNQHRYSIRFLHQPRLAERAIPTDDEVTFRLAQCGI